MRCQACGEEVRTVTLPDGSRVRINARSEFGKGPSRFLVEPEDADRARPVTESFEGHAHAEHSMTCRA